jgi:aminoglycoside phosphotransferase (APT) family kinase protein
MIDGPDPDLFRAPPPAESLRWVEASLGSGAHVVGVQHLPGGLSASVHALDVRASGGPKRQLVLKRFLWDDPNEADMAHREARVLDLVRVLRLPTPELLALDRTGSESGATSLLMTRLPGRPVLHPRDGRRWVSELARLLPEVHALDVRGVELDEYRPYSVADPAEPPVWTARPRIWERAIEIFKGPSPEPPNCFIHRDFHPGNVLWRGSAVTGLIDWLHGCLGSPGADLGHCRGNVWDLEGRGAADRLLDAYRREVPSAPPYHPYWDLAAALGGLPDIRPGGSGGTPPQRRRQLEGFVADAVSRLA